jgi:hypothetical protein
MLRKTRSGNVQGPIVYNGPNYEGVIGRDHLLAEAKVCAEQIRRLIVLAGERGIKWPTPELAAMFLFALDLLSEVHPAFKVTGRGRQGRKRGPRPKWNAIEELFLVMKFVEARKLGMTKEAALEHVRQSHYDWMSEANTKGKGSLYERLKVAFKKMEQDPAGFWEEFTSLAESGK